MLPPSGSMGIERQTTAPNGKNWCDLPAMSRDRCYKTDALPEPQNRDSVRYEHVCPICQAKRTAKRPQPQWRCVACQNAGLEGEVDHSESPEDAGGCGCLTTALSVAWMSHAWSFATNWCSPSGISYPVSDGHLLVVTTRHVADWFEASEEEQRAVLRALDRGRQIILERHAADGFNVGVNIGEAAGQTIPHLHVHLIPRFDGDVPDPRGGVRHVIPSRGNYLKSRPAGLDLLQGPSTESLLVRGADDPLLPHVRACLDQAASADFAVAFILEERRRLGSRAPPRPA